MSNNIPEFSFALPPILITIGIFDDGIHYVTSDSMDKRTYLVFTITPEKYEYELVKY